MTNEQGNASNEAPLSNEELDSNDFFAGLENEVNGGILESDDSSQQLSNNKETVSEVQQENVETLKKRYADSSKEGQRLNTRLKELEPYLPILDEMRKDSGLINHVRDYFESGGQTPQNVTSKLDLPEDFIFDADEAVSEPNSDSAKVLNSTIDNVVQRKLSNELGKQREEMKVNSEINSFKQKHDMDDNQWDEFKNYADARSLSLDDILYLKQRESGEPMEARNVGVSEKAANHTRKAQMKPQSLATTGSASTEVDSDDQLFDAILGIDKQLDSAFG
jgi:hypothetical protein|tara:strand:+ start:7298 stop:8131 length:834 start_codon:yes stop_codon:yes gene_type:complete